jgi:hypothetical protein
LILYYVLELLVSLKNEAVVTNLQLGPHLTNQITLSSWMSMTLYHTSSVFPLAERIPVGSVYLVFLLVLFRVLSGFMLQFLLNYTLTSNFYNTYKLYMHKNHSWISFFFFYLICYYIISYFFLAIIQFAHQISYTFFLSDKIWWL